MGDHVPASSKNNEAGFTILELLVVLAVIAVLAGIALNTAFYAFDVSRAGRTVSDMRGISTAVMKYESDHGGIPGGGLQPVADVVAATGREMAGTVAEEDGWGNTIYYEDVRRIGWPVPRTITHKGEIGLCVKKQPRRRKPRGNTTTATRRTISISRYGAA